MKPILLLLLPLIIFKANSQNYSIDYLLDYLQKSGYYEVIFSIKSLYGNDFAIGFCKTYVVMTLHCEEVVAVYMIKIGGTRGANSVKPSSKIVPQNEIDKINDLIDFLNQNYLDILLKNNNNDMNEVKKKSIILKKTLSNKSNKSNNQYVLVEKEY